MTRIVLAMSGGVDSSVAAYLLQQQGFDIVGVFMRHGEQSPVGQCEADSVLPAGGGPGTGGRRDHKQGCCSAQDAEDARRVADQLSIPFYALNLQAEFARIIDYFVHEYQIGRTPNPCVMCNHWLKFGKLFDYADSVGAEYVATGHYSRLVREPGTRVPRLLAGVDRSKDQSYALFGIDRDRLGRMLLPVGEYRKSQIREFAAEIGLRVADKKDSQEICFVTDGKHAEFVRRQQPDCEARSGEIVTLDGRVVGHHNGIEAFTIGQRKGLGVALGEPHFVVRIEADSRRVVLARREALGRRQLTADRTNWLQTPPSGSFSCQAKIRYNSPAAQATATVLDGDRLAVEFAEPQFGVAPGQAVVCYDGPQVLGGGWIE